MTFLIKNWDLKRSACFSLPSGLLLINGKLRFTKFLINKLPILYHFLSIFFLSILSFFFEEIYSLIFIFLSFLINFILFSFFLLLIFHSFNKFLINIFFLYHFFLPLCFFLSFSLSSLIPWIIFPLLSFLLTFFV